MPRISGNTRLEIQHDELDSFNDRVRIVADDSQGTFEIATFNHRYSRAEIEGTAKLMAKATELETSLQLAERTLRSEYAKNCGKDAGILWYALEQIRTTLASVV